MDHLCFCSSCFGFRFFVWLFCFVCFGCLGLFIFHIVCLIMLSVISFSFCRFSGLTQETVNMETLSPTRDRYNDMRAYNHSKLCNILFARTLAARLNQQGVTILSLHPGNMMSTSLSRHWWLYRLLFAVVRPFTKSMVSLATVYPTVKSQCFWLEFSFLISVFLFLRFLCISYF